MHMTQNINTRKYVKYERCFISQNTQMPASKSLVSPAAKEETLLELGRLLSQEQGPGINAQKFTAIAAAAINQFDQGCGSKDVDTVRATYASIGEIIFEASIAAAEQQGGASVEDRKSAILLEYEQFRGQLGQLKKNYPDGNDGMQHVFPGSKAYRLINLIIKLSQELSEHPGALQSPGTLTTVSKADLETAIQGYVDEFGKQKKVLPMTTSDQDDPNAFRLIGLYKKKVVEEAFESFRNGLDGERLTLSPEPMEDMDESLVFTSEEIFKTTNAIAPFDAENEEPDFITDNTAKVMYQKDAKVSFEEAAALCDVSGERRSSLISVAADKGIPLIISTVVPGKKLPDATPLFPPDIDGSNAIWKDEEKTQKSVGAKHAAAVKIALHRIALNYMADILQSHLNFQFVTEEEMSEAVDPLKTINDLAGLKINLMVREKNHKLSERILPLLREIFSIVHDALTKRAAIPDSQAPTPTEEARSNMLVVYGLSLLATSLSVNTCSKEYADASKPAYPGALAKIVKACVDWMKRFNKIKDPSEQLEASHVAPRECIFEQAPDIARQQGFVSKRFDIQLINFVRLLNDHVLSDNHQIPPLAAAAASVKISEVPASAEPGQLPNEDHSKRIKEMIRTVQDGPKDSRWSVGRSKPAQCLSKDQALATLEALSKLQPDDHNKHLFVDGKLHCCVRPFASSECSWTFGMLGKDNLVVKQDGACLMAHSEGDLMCTKAEVEKAKAHIQASKDARKERKSNSGSSSPAKKRKPNPPSAKKGSNNSWQANILCRNGANCKKFAEGGSAACGFKHSDQQQNAGPYGPSGSSVQQMDGNVPMLQMVHSLQASINQLQQQFGQSQQPMMMPPVPYQQPVIGLPPAAAAPPTPPPLVITQNLNEAERTTLQQVATNPELVRALAKQMANQQAADRKKHHDGASTESLTAQVAELSVHEVPTNQSHTTIAGVQVPIDERIKGHFPISDQVYIDGRVVAKDGSCSVIKYIYSDTGSMPAHGNRPAAQQPSSC